MPLESRLKEFIPHRRTLRADFSKRATAVLVARLVVLRPIVSLGIPFSLTQPELQILQPFLDLIRCFENKTSDEPTEAYGYLRRVHYDALNWGVEGDLARHGIE